MRESQKVSIHGALAGLFGRSLALADYVKELARQPDAVTRDDLRALMQQLSDMRENVQSVRIAMDRAPEDERQLELGAWMLDSKEKLQ